MRTEAQRRAERKYDSKNTRMFAFKLNLKTDQEIIEKLDSVKNRQGYIKNLIKKDLENQK